MSEQGTSAQETTLKSISIHLGMLRMRETFVAIQMSTPDASEKPHVCSEPSIHFLNLEPYNYKGQLQSKPARIPKP